MANDKRSSKRCMICKNMLGLMHYNVSNGSDTRLVCSKACVAKADKLGYKR